MARLSNSVLTIAFEGIGSLEKEDLNEAWHKRLHNTLMNRGYLLKSIEWDELKEAEYQKERRPQFDRQCKLMQLQSNESFEVTINYWDTFAMYSRFKAEWSASDISELFFAWLARLEHLARAVTFANECFVGTMELDEGGERKLWIGGNAERIERFNRLEWPQDTERSLLLDWLSKPGAEVISREDENLYVVTGNQKALLHQSPINGMLLPVPEEVGTLYYRFSDEAWECELEKTLPFTSLDDWIEKQGEPDFELPPVEFDSGRQNIMRQIGYLNMSSKYVVILRRYEDGSITVILAGKPVVPR